jgi:hypothetical protein
MKEYKELLISLIHSIVITLVPISALPKETLTSLELLLSAVSKTKYTASSRTIKSRSFSDLAAVAIFLLAAKLPVESIDAMKAS